MFSSSQTRPTKVSSGKADDKDSVAKTKNIQRCLVVLQARNVYAVCIHMSYENSNQLTTVSYVPGTFHYWRLFLVGTCDSCHVSCCFCKIRHWRNISVYQSRNLRIKYISKERKVHFPRHCSIRQLSEENQFAWNPALQKGNCNRGEQIRRVREREKNSPSLCRRLLSIQRMPS